MGRIAELFNVWVRDNQTLAELERVVEYEYDRLTAENADLQQRLDAAEEALKVAQGEAESLAVAIWRKHYKDESPEWGLCDSVAGIISQINNMTAGLEEALTAASSRVERLREALEEIKVERCFDAQCACCKVDRNIAQKALADDAKEVKGGV